MVAKQTAASRMAGNLARRSHGWAVRHPDLTGRLGRAIALAPLVREGATDHYGWHYSVPSDSHPGERHHVVVFERADGSLASSCDCEDRPRKGHKGIFRCKHRLAVALAATEGLVTNPTTTQKAAE